MTKKTKDEDCADCWSPSERKIKAFFEFTKKVLFYPVVVLLVKLGVTANMVSYFSAFVGLVATVYLWYDLRIAAILLLVSLAIDGIDGSVARASKKKSLRGSITDCFCDQFAISATTIGFIALGLVDPVIGALYLVVYPTVIAFSIIRNIIKKPASYVLRPRIIVFAVFWLYVITSLNIFNYVILPLSLILLYQVIRDFYVLRAHLKN
ncbi:CDP-alcohol phosphatidyltransferase family protein [Candidatus Woesearchaeota archaeon]|jgi:phosphatidylglycerophosphate synthase|nr:CDP-alcohol phosphatidyltransferase family protein [Candidatus Woesearchaeota archaeon]MBT3537512.1 CDP-alcohol phosphatidyltransferase family protein [Candidatus Woesearchaeota archaeon]MBT4696816.1 CDP-alcohol phosphatidyltransferase family protein [Candidatus Woesearchaeota archaeon]MBT4717637.1 CDP-alcohol phosphatidyltransferase family protein [Candidatus Woesearchaeota archaeon]MBT7106178.1 CDP-alcohol phosphatidyltransferase family protein [Candidatus Woesearchaeota archaeon]